MALCAMYLFAFGLGFQVMAASWIVRFADVGVSLVTAVASGAFLVTAGGIGIIGAQLGASALPTALVACAAAIAATGLIAALGRWRRKNNGPRPA